MDQLIVIGGGAAGFFGALAAKEANPDARVRIVEKSAKLLNKVRISGGGRCNATHNCFDPRALIAHYPRGSRELLGPFSRFQPRDTVQWFRERGVKLKAESDGRMFPITDSSETIINCLQGEAERLGVRIDTGVNVISVNRQEQGFELQLKGGQQLHCESLLLATGSAAKGHQLAQQLGHTIIPPVPSLFTFNVPDSPLEGLEGVAVPNAVVTLEGFKHRQQGPVLVTHWGFSGPAPLKLSAWAARDLHDRDYQATLVIDWLPEVNQDELRRRLAQVRQQHPKQLLSNNRLVDLPKQLWRRQCRRAGIREEQKAADLSNQQITNLLSHLKQDRFQVLGKTTYKEEFVTCGGVSRKEVNFKTMESKVCPGLYLAGEVLDIDGVTGGFNFQNAWTTSWIAGKSFS